MKKVIYLDNAATTRVRPEVVEAMLPYFTEHYGNPSSVYDFSTPCKKAMAHTREVIAGSLGASENEIYFTNGGTEADNWALKAAAEAYASKGKHIITTQIEHHAVLHTGQYLEKLGYEVTYLPVDENGVVSVDALKKAVRPDTILISVMFANNEIGTIEPIREIGEVAKEHGILFHTDAVQAYCHEPINVDELHIDMLSASAHKFNGPKGVGFLYIRKGLKLRSFIHGGAQERKRRAGTENVPGIVGLGKAVELSLASMKENKKKETELRDHLIHRVMTEIPYVRLNGHPSQRLSNNANFSFQFIEGESLLIMLDMAGIGEDDMGQFRREHAVRCQVGDVHDGDHPHLFGRIHQGHVVQRGDPSHVLLAIGLPHEIAHGSLRLTLGEETTMEDIDYTVDQLKRIVERLRSMSPLYEDFVKSREKKENQ